MPRYFIVDQSALDEIGSYRGQTLDEVILTLEEILREDDREALDNLIIIYGDAVDSVTKAVLDRSAIINLASSS